MSCNSTEICIHESLNLSEAHTKYLEEATGVVEPILVMMIQSNGEVQFLSNNDNLVGTIALNLLLTSESAENSEIKIDIASKISPIINISKTYIKGVGGVLLCR